MNTPRIERWWVDCLFLALDRIIEDRLLDRKPTSPSQYASLLDNYGFMELTGKPTLEKRLAIKHLVALYDACGGRQRFSEEATRERTTTLIPDVRHFLNDPGPVERFTERIPVFSKASHQPAQCLRNTRALKTCPPMTLRNLISRIS